MGLYMGQDHPLCQIFSTYPSNCTLYPSPHCAVTLKADYRHCTDQLFCSQPPVRLASGKGMGRQKERFGHLVPQFLPGWIVGCFSSQGPCWVASLAEEDLATTPFSCLFRTRDPHYCQPWALTHPLWLPLPLSTPCKQFPLNSSVPFTRSVSLDPEQLHPHWGTCLRLAFPSHQLECCHVFPFIVFSNPITS